MNVCSYSNAQQSPANGKSAICVERLPAPDALLCTRAAQNQLDDSWEALNQKIESVALAVSRTDNPQEMGAYAVARLRHSLEFCSLLLGGERVPSSPCAADAAHQKLIDELWHGADPA